MIKEERYIKLDGETSLFSQIKEVGSNTWIVMTHGIAEYSSRHQYLLRLFPENRNIFLYDLRGHGKSSGKRGYIEDFSVYIDDLRKVLTYLKTDFRMKRYFLVGHSMGALITASFMQQWRDEDNLPYPEKVFLSSPPVGVDDLLGKFLMMSPKMLSLLHQVKQSIALGGMVSAKKLSHDGRVYQQFISDDLNLKKLHTKLLLSLLVQAKETFARPLNLKCPLAASVGTDDTIVSVEAFRDYFKNIEKNAELLFVEEGLHELHNEVEIYRKKYFKFLTNFLLN